MKVVHSTLIAILGLLTLPVPAWPAGKALPKKPTLSYGFETEFVNSKLGHELEDAIARGEHPLLDPRFTNEETTMNIEVRSRPSFGEYRTQMEEALRLQKILGKNLKGYHFHLRAPTTRIDEIGKEKIRAWLALIGDYVYAWRLENKNPRLVLVSKTVGRPHPQNLSERWTVRLIETAQYFDFEVRGFMGDLAQLEKALMILSAGIENPSLIPPTPEGWEKTRDLGPHFHIVTRVDDYRRLHSLPPLTPLQKNILRDAYAWMRAENILPHFSFENLPWLSPTEHFRITTANDRYVASVAQAIDLPAGKEVSSRDLTAMITSAIQNWSREAQISSILGKKLQWPDVAPITCGQTLKP